MVFYYSIRGGPCRNANSHIILDGQKDIICYVGRDKHENEFLIKYGWPGDIWFHVDSLSSAHVYFRIKNLHSNTRIPVDGIPIDDCKSAICNVLIVVRHVDDSLLNLIISYHKYSAYGYYLRHDANLQKQLDRRQQASILQNGVHATLQSQEDIWDGQWYCDLPQHETVSLWQMW